MNTITGTRIDRIRALNDALRRHGRGGEIMLSHGVAVLDSSILTTVVAAVSNYDSFDPRTDPYSEHDFGSVKSKGHSVLFKIDYYDSELRYHSPDPADPALTRRVMTIMLTEEY